MLANKVKLLLVYMVIASAVSITGARAGDPLPVFSTEVTAYTGYDRLVASLNYLVTNALLLGELIAVGAIVFYGLKMAMAKGEPTKFNEAKGMLVKACIGAAIIFGVYTIIITVYTAARSIGQ